MLAMNSGPAAAPPPRPSLFLSCYLLETEVARVMGCQGTSPSLLSFEPSIYRPLFLTTGHGDITMIPALNTGRTHITILWRESYGVGSMDQECCFAVLLFDTVSHNTAPEVHGPITGTGIIVCNYLTFFSSSLTAAPTAPLIEWL